MSEFRKDPIVDRWVIIAPGRAQRPHALAPELAESAPEDPRDCPFCAGRESATPPAVLSCRAAGGPPGSWQVRVVPNKFPALHAGAASTAQTEGRLYQARPGVGAHEVIIECPQHQPRMARLSVDNIRLVLEVYRERLRNLREDPRLAHGLVFKNSGLLAGASLDHAHSQLIVSPVLPISIREEIDGARAYFQDGGGCIYCNLVDEERRTAQRIVLESPGFVVFCPFASRFAFESWVVPKRHLSHYEDLDPESVAELGTVLKKTLSRLDLKLSDPPFNYVIHSAPFDSRDLPHYHWHLEIFPRLTRVAGFEWGSGVYINQQPPEQAAAALRDPDK